MARVCQSTVQVDNTGQEISPTSRCLLCGWKAIGFESHSTCCTGSLSTHATRAIPVWKESSPEPVLTNVAYLLPTKAAMNGDNIATTDTTIEALRRRPTPVRAIKLMIMAIMLASRLIGL